MKAILSYENYYSYGKKYQVKFIYDNESEAEKFTSYVVKFIYENELESQKMTSNLKPFEEKELIIPYYTKLIDKKEKQKTTNVIERTNIPKAFLIPFITMLISIKNCKIIIGKDEITSFDINTIQESIDKLHINGTLNKGEFFNLGDTYYITFRYATTEQKDELSYYFNCKLNYNETNGMYPIAIDRSGCLTNKNNGTIIGTNIPKSKLSEFIKVFIEEYNMIITIGNEKLKEEFNEEKFNNALTTLSEEISLFSPVVGKSRKRTKAGY